MKKVFLAGFGFILISGALFFHYNIHSAQAVLPTCTTLSSPKLLAAAETYECSCPTGQSCAVKINTGAFNSQPELKVWLSNLSTYCQSYWGGPITMNTGYDTGDYGVSGISSGACSQTVTYKINVGEKKIWASISGASTAAIKFSATETGVTCSSHYEKRCDGGNLYWYNQCYVKEDLAQTCTDGCGWVSGSYQCLAPTCSNECSSSGSKTCSGSGYKTCGNYDSDSCLEWSTITNCGTDETCSGGSCVSTRMEIPYGQSTPAGYDLHSTGSSFGGTWNLFVNIPSSYSKSQVSLEASGSSCLQMYIKSPCESAKLSGASKCSGGRVRD